MDHSHDHAPVLGPWAGGWAIALLAGLFAAALSRVIGQVDITAAAIVGAVVFGVYGVLLGSGGVELTVSEGHGDGHDHGHH
ncbi:MAG: hypothetical protein ACD_54C00206G0005 [uncultured bacterium]|nr:MAG: hypothetical protein ACD_54C00206G0005 [uncultured bacterium]